MKKNIIALGIDLGTTNSEMCGVTAEGEPTPVKNAEGELITESVVYELEKGGFVVGTVACNAGGADPIHCISQVKRLMGHRDAEGQPVVPYVGRDGENCTPVDASSHILGKLKRDAETKFGKAVTHVVIAVPAYFNDNARRDTVWPSGATCGRWAPTCRRMEGRWRGSLGELFKQHGAPLLMKMDGGSIPTCQLSCRYGLWLSGGFWMHFPSGQET